MSTKVIYPLIVGCCLMAIGASSKAILDVAFLKADNKNHEKTLSLIYGELKIMRKDIKQLIQRGH